jgi:hypothetical protein
VRVECPETSQFWDVPILANFVQAPIAAAVLVLDRSGSMGEDGGDGRTRRQVLLDAAPRSLMSPLRERGSASSVSPLTPHPVRQ